MVPFVAPCSPSDRQLQVMGITCFKSILGRYLSSRIMTYCLIGGQNGTFLESSTYSLHFFVLMNLFHYFFIMRPGGSSWPPLIPVYCNINLSIYSPTILSLSHPCKALNTSLLMPLSISVLHTRFNESTLHTSLSIKSFKHI